MPTATLDFRTITPGDLDLDGVFARYAAVEAALEAATGVAALRRAIDTWDQLRKEVDTWEALVGVRFRQDTRDPERKAARERLDRIRPQMEERLVTVLRRLLAHPLRRGLEDALGTHVFRLWTSRTRAFDPAIEADLVEESRLAAEYTALLASAQIAFRGETLNLSQLARYDQDPDRSVRHEASRLRWAFLAEKGEVLDRTYDDLVRVRDRMARTLGFPGFVPLGYERLLRTDYGPAEVEGYRRQILAHVVPLAVELRQRQRSALGVESLMAWDEAIRHPAGNPRPEGGSPEMHAAARSMFDDMGAGLGPFFRMMEASHLLDLEARPGKAGGGFCTTFPAYGVPFVFANFNGTKDDVDVFTHEMGHAFQAWESRHHVPLDLQFPTLESCEIHSMGLELLAWPWMDRFFGEEAERYRVDHLTGAILFLPYGAAVDEFQHRVYSEPEASPALRHDWWREIESRYLPWRDWGDLARPAMGAAWQRQAHVYHTPFYYIDYTLAQVCAFQLWERARRDRAAAMSTYVTLCRMGGERPFGEILRSVGLQSPFEEGCLERVAGDVRRALGV